jgi:hypothetical protein
MSLQSQAAVTRGFALESLLRVAFDDRLQKLYKQVYDEFNQVISSSVRGRPTGHEINRKDLLESV